MSYYQFQGPVQGGFGPLDDDMRRRRRHYRDAGAPYSGGISQPQARLALPAPQQVGVSPEEGPSGPLAPQYAPDRALAPRQGAAVDLGQGPQQPMIGQPPQQLMLEPSAAQEHAMHGLRPDEEKTDVLAGYERVSGDPTPLQEHTMHGLRPDEEKTALEGPRGDIGAFDLGEDLEQKQPESSEPSSLGSYRGTGLGRGAGVQPARPERPAPRGRGFSARPKQQPGFGPDRGKRRHTSFDPMRPFRELPKNILGRGMKEWKSRPLTQGERQKFPVGFQKSQAEEYLRHRQATERGALHRFPRGVQPSQDEEFARQRKRKVSFGGVTGIRPVPKGKAARFTPGGISAYEPSERAKHQGYQQLGQNQGREMARREHQIVLDKMRSQNRNLISAIQKRGGQQLDAKERTIREQTRQGGALVREGHELARKANLMEAQKTQQIKGLQQGMGREGLRAQRAEQRVGQLLQEGRSLESTSKKQIKGLQQGMGREGLRAQRAEQRVGQLLQEGRSLDAQHKKAKMGHEIDLFLKDTDYDSLKQEANRRIQNLEKKINDGSADREAAQKEIDTLTKQLAAASKKPEAKQDRDGLKDLRDDIAGLKAAMKSRPAAGSAQAPIVVQGGAGGGGASSSAGGSSASSGGGGAPAAARAPDLSKVVEAVKQIAGAAAKKKGGGTKGITQARRSYTDKRKAKIAELRALKSKRIREFASKTKKLPKAERLKQRREYKKRVEAQFKEMQTRFPTARGLKSVGVIRELIRKIDAFKSAK